MKTLWNGVAALVLVGALLGSCASAGAGGTVPEDQLRYLKSREWKLIQMEGRLVEADHPTLVFDAGGEGNLAGYTGLNRYFGSWSVEGRSMKLTMTGMTKMAGDPAAMAMEQDFAAWLDGSAFDWDLADQVLNLYRDGRLVLMFAAVVQ